MAHELIFAKTSDGAVGVVLRGVQFLGKSIIGVDSEIREQDLVAIATQNIETMISLEHRIAESLRGYDWRGEERDIVKLVNGILLCPSPKEFSVLIDVNRYASDDEEDWFCFTIKIRDNEIVKIEGGD